jgi:hypothetical protein
MSEASKKTILQKRSAIADLVGWVDTGNPTTSYLLIYLFTYLC